MARSEAERVLAARITGIARRYARGGQLTEAEEAEALTSIIAVATGRTDILAQVAGLVIGFSRGAPDEPLARQAAELLIKAGADLALMPEWVEEGRRRAEGHRRARTRPETR